LLLPGALTVTWHVPTVLPAVNVPPPSLVQSPELLYTTGSPEVVLHAMVKLLLTVSLEGTLHVIFWINRAALVVCETGVAAE
jgi:hypothetical protein